MAEITQGTILYGMMGCGKSVLGEGLAAHLGQPFTDTDRLVEEAAGATCSDVIADPNLDFASI